MTAFDEDRDDESCAGGVSEQGVIDCRGRRRRGHQVQLVDIEDAGEDADLIRVETAAGDTVRDDFHSGHCRLGVLLSGRVVETAAELGLGPAVEEPVAADVESHDRVPVVDAGRRRG